jgi:hypothetical protein
MALVKCSECGAKVSDKAATCPQCGAPVEPGAVKQVNTAVKKHSTVGMGCLILFAVGAIGAAITGDHKGGASGQSVADSNSVVSNTAEDKAQDKRAEMAAVAVASLKNALRDPDSFKLERAFTTMDAKYACILYRARNGFGGMNREHVVFTEAGGDQSARGWNKHCVKGEFSEQTPNAETLANYINPSS